MICFTSNAKTTTCDGVTRRDFLHAGALGAIGLTLGNLAALRAKGAIKPNTDNRASIMTFNPGAPSQLDLFAPKPGPPAEIRGPFKPINTKGDFQLSELLP